MQGKKIDDQVIMQGKNAKYDQVIIQQQKLKFTLEKMITVS